MCGCGNGGFHGGRGGSRNGGYRGKKICSMSGVVKLDILPSVVINVLMLATTGRRSMRMPLLLATMLTPNGILISVPLITLLLSWTN
jgi:hypothetical protein